MARARSMRLGHRFAAYRLGPIPGNYRFEESRRFQMSRAQVFGAPRKRCVSTKTRTAAATKIARTIIRTFFQRPFCTHQTASVYLPAYSRGGARCISLRLFDLNECPLDDVRRRVCKVATRVIGLRAVHRVRPTCIGSSRHAIDRGDVLQRRPIRPKATSRCSRARHTPSPPRQTSALRDRPRFRPQRFHPRKWSR